MGDSDSQKLLQDDEEFEGSQEYDRDIFGSSNLETEAAAVVSLAGQNSSWKTSCPKLSLQWYRIRKSWVTEEAILLAKLAVPLILAFFFQQSFFFVSILFVGHISGKSRDLDAAALALSFANVTGLAVGIGLASAADTLSAQVYGFKNYKKVGIILQRGILILTIAMLPIFVLWLNAETVLLLLQQSSCVARITGHFMQIYCLALPAIILFGLLQRYLQSQSIVWTMVMILILSNIINVTLHAVLIFAAHLGVIGAAIALSLSFTSSPLLLIAYVWFRGLHKQTWGGWSWESLHEWDQFLKLAIPGLIMICAEWWIFEITTLVTGAIDETQLAINAVFVSLLAPVYMFTTGVGVAAGVRVGNELGAGNPVKAKRASYSAMGMITFWAVLITITFLAAKNQIGKLFVEERAVIDGVAVTMYAAATQMFFDQLQGTLSGILRGCGRLTLGAVVNFGAYYIIGLPVGISLALAADMGTLGVWIGLAIATILVTVVFLIAVLTTDWEYQSQRAIKNAQGRKDSNTDEMESTIVEEENTVSEVLRESDGSEDGHVIPVVEEDEDYERSDDRLPRDGGIEEIPLVSFEDGEQPVVQADITQLKTVKVKSRVKLLLYRSIFFVAGVVLLIAGGIGSQYHPTADFSNCTDVDAHSINSSVSLISNGGSTISSTDMVSKVVMPTPTI